MLADGSGAHAPDHTRMSNAEVECAANDVLGTVSINIRQETPAASSRCWTSLPALAAYALAAIQPYEWYADAEAEKGCLSGTYAAFALGLANASHFELLRHYMELVDDEHQSVQDRYVPAFLERHGLTPDTVSTVVACLRCCTDNFKLSAKPALDDAPTLALVADALAALPEHDRSPVRERLFGPDKKLTALARKAEEPFKALLLRLLSPQDG